MNEIPTIDWKALDALLVQAHETFSDLATKLRDFDPAALDSAAIGAGVAPEIVRGLASVTADLSGGLSALALSMRSSVPVLARQLGQDPDAEVGICPRCGVALTVPPAGSIRCHKDCGFCDHPAMDGGVCAICGAERGSLQWVFARSLRPATDPACGSVLVEKLVETAARVAE
jgi:hypothetical protein